VQRIKKEYNYTSLYHNLNVEGKVRWRILKNFNHLSKYELVDWRDCWAVQQNVNENRSSSQMFCSGAQLPQVY
jgi:hypothetical protein